MTPAVSQFSASSKEGSHFSGSLREPPSALTPGWRGALAGDEAEADFFSAFSAAFCRHFIARPEGACGARRPQAHPSTTL